MSIGTTAIELCDFKNKKKEKKNMDKMGNSVWGIIFAFGYFLLIFLVYSLALVP